AAGTAARRTRGPGTRPGPVGRIGPGWTHRSSTRRSGYRTPDPARPATGRHRGARPGGLTDTVVRALVDWPTPWCAPWWTNTWVRFAKGLYAPLAPREPFGG